MEVGTQPVIVNDPDDALGITYFVKKYQRHFATHFLPKHCVSLKIVQVIGDNVRVVARLRTMAMLSSKTRNDDTFLVPKKDVEDWRKNVKLHTFMAGGIK